MVQFLHVCTVCTTIIADRRGVAAPLVTAWNLTDGVQLQLLNKTLHVQVQQFVLLIYLYNSYEYVNI